MATVESIVDNYTLSNTAKKFIIDEARIKGGLSLYRGQPDAERTYNEHKESYMLEKIDFLIKGDYKFTFAKCQQATDVSETIDLLGWNKAYQLTHNQPILGVVDICPTNNTSTHPARFLTTRQAFKEGYVKNKEVYYPESDADVVQRFFYNDITEVLYSKYEIDINNIEIKILPPDNMMPAAILKVFALYLARVITADDINRLDFLGKLDREYDMQVTACSRYRVAKKDVKPLTNREKWLNDIKRSRSYV